MHRGGDIILRNTVAFSASYAFRTEVIAEGAAWIGRCNVLDEHIRRRLELFRYQHDDVNRRAGSGRDLNHRVSGTASLARTGDL